jgi:signal peptidase I
VLSSKTLQTGLPLARVGGLLRWLAYGAFVIFLVALASALAAAVVPRAFGYSTLVVQGGSMGDSIPNGSLVIARRTAAEQVRVGDAIVVQEETDNEPSRPKLHRIVSLDEEGGQTFVTTKGDANQTADPNEYILPDRVLTPALTVPHLGYLAGFAMTPLGWVFLVLLPATVLAAITLRGIWTDDDAVVEERQHGVRLPLGLTLFMLLSGVVVVGIIDPGLASALLIDTASVADNSFTTAASFP